MKGFKNLIVNPTGLIKFTKKIASHEKGSAPSAGYFEELITEAEKILKEATIKGEMVHIDMSHDLWKEVSSYLTEKQKNEENKTSS
ncbi:MAG: hypothetical protein NTZ33_13970 [Bacteroidetes bacterium]|nr:hypothetical protein [Bacteroidota bacterium]